MLASVRQSSLFRLVPRSARYRSARTVYNADAAVFETVYTPTEEYSVYRFVSKPVHRLWNEEGRWMDVEGGGKEGGWRKCISRAPDSFVTFVTLLSSRLSIVRKDGRSISRSSNGGGRSLFVDPLIRIRVPIIHLILKFLYTFKLNEENVGEWSRDN